MENICSPLTNKNNISKKYILDIDKVKTQYFNQYQIDTTRFFNGIEELAVYECLDSTLQFYYPFTVASDGLFYSDLARFYKGYYTLWRWEHEKAFRLINQNHKVLEIGCGNGHFLKQVKEKNAEVTGLDFNPDAVEYGKKNRLSIFNHTVNEHSIKYPEHYDVICAFQLFEHVNDVGNFISDTLKCLKTGGLLVIGVPNNDSYYFKNDPYHTLNLPPHHMLLWNHKALSSLGDFYQLEIISIENQPVEIVHKGMMYNNWLRNNFGIFFSKIAGLLTRFIIKKLPVFKNDGVTVLAIYKKK